MNLEQIYARIGELIAEGHGQWPVLLTDIDEEGTGHVYEPVEVDVLVGDDDEWVNVDIRHADLGDLS